MRDPARLMLAALAALLFGALAAAPAARAAEAGDQAAFDALDRLVADAPPPTDADLADADLTGPALADDGLLAPPEPSPTAGRLADWVAATGDNQGLPYIIVDKPTAEVMVYDGSGRPLGRAPALLGSAIGDDSAPGVADRELADIPMDERTTPAGRFVANYGPALGEKHQVLWVDWTDAVSLHPVAGARREQRPERLRSPTPDDNRITHGCINVSAAFYRRVVRPAFAHTRGVVYVLPDVRPLEAVFPAFAAQVRADAGAGGFDLSSAAPR